MSDSLLFCNGIDAAAGDYALPPMEIVYLGQAEGRMEAS
jgi:hypothetical protein